MISTDQSIFKESSVVRQRILEYGDLFEELHVIVYTKRELRMKNYELRIGQNIFLYPTKTIFKLLYFFDAYKIAKKVIHNSSFTIHNSAITTQDPFETALVGYWLKKKFKLPLQIQSHSDFLSPFFASESLKNRLRILLGQRLIKKADGVRVVSERVRQSLVSKLQIQFSKITVLPIVYDMERFRNQPIGVDLRKKYQDYDFIILSASRLTVEKNIGLAIEAMREIVKKYPKALLLLVGDGPEREKLRLQVISYRLQENAIFEPWTNDLVSYYRTADLFLMTSNYEGGARAPAEAVAAGLPVVMTDVAPANEIIKDGINGFVVPVGDCRQLSERTLDLLNDKNKRAAFSQAALDIAKNFPTKEEYLKRYQKSLTDLLLSGT